MPPVNTVRDTIMITEQNSLGLEYFDEKATLDTLGELAHVLDDYLSSINTIERDYHLTAEGQSAAKKVAAKKALTAIEKWHAPLKQTREGHEAQLREKLSGAVAPARPSDPARALEAALVRGEIRRAVADLDDLAIELLYRQGDARTRQALDEAPRVTVGKGGTAHVRPYVSDAVRDEALREAGAAALPEEAGRLAELELVGRVYSGAVASATRQVEDLAPGAIEREIVML